MRAFRIAARSGSRSTPVPGPGPGAPSRVLGAAGGVTSPTSGLSDVVDAVRALLHQHARKRPRRRAGEHRSGPRIELTVMARAPQAAFAGAPEHCARQVRAHSRVADEFAGL